MDNQQIKARFFGQHIGCRISGAGIDGILEGFRPASANGDSFLRLYFSDSAGFQSTVTNCKLILRPLSYITQQECLDYVTSIAPKADDIEEVSLMLYEGLRGKNQITTETHYRFADYLRSINICVPFMGLDPVKEGWAVLSE